MSVDKFIPKPKTGSGHPLPDSYDPTHSDGGSEGMGGNTSAIGSKSVGGIPAAVDEFDAQFDYTEQTNLPTPAMPKAGPKPVDYNPKNVDKFNVLP